MRKQYELSKEFSAISIIMVGLYYLVRELRPMPSRKQIVLNLVFDCMRTWYFVSFIVIILMAFSYII